MKRKIPCAVLGSTGIVGQRFVRLLAGHPYFDIVCLAASSRSAGKTYGEAVDDLEGEWDEAGIRDQKIVEATAANIVASGARVAFVALPAATAKELECDLREKGLFIFSNASAHRMDADVPLVIPEVNAEHLALSGVQMTRHKGFIVTNSNCTASGLVMALRPLVPFGLRAVTVASYQAVSGAGRRGVSGWDILGNVIPYIAQEEEKIERESKKILGTFTDGCLVPLETEVYASCCRVPVKDGHLESVVVELKKDVSLPAFSDALASFRGLPQELKLPTAPKEPLIVRKEMDRPQPILDLMAGMPERARGMAVSVGRIRKKGKSFGFFLLVHNLIRGAAGSSVLNAELSYRQGYLTGYSSPQF